MLKPIQFCPRCGHTVEDREKFGKTRRVCPACDYIHFIDPKVAAIALLEQDDRILLIKRGVDPERGKWSIPGGYVDYGEDPAQAAVREVVEETGLRVEIIRLLDVFPPGGSNNATIVIAYSARVLDGVLSAADDVVEADWFGPDAIPELASFPSTRHIVDNWLAQFNR